MRRKEVSVENKVLLRAEGQDRGHAHWAVMEAKRRAARRGEGLKDRIMGTGSRNHWVLSPEPSVSCELTADDDG